MTPARLLFIAAVAAALIGARGAEAQFPRGLLAAPPERTSGRAFCSIETRPLSFGIYDPLSDVDVDALAQVIYVCNNQANNIRIEMTTGAAGQFDRIMSASAVEHLSYNIYLDPTHRTIWGQGLFGTDVYVQSNPPNNTAVVVLGYGRIPSGQNVSAGNYADVLTVRVLF